ncbi:MAG: hypothetical protein IPQ27_09215 [Chitinophagaceae bacterium]|nr:hypothetical protein [Chitinophagaceae bacterium]
MKRTRFTESQIVASIKKQESGISARMFAVSWVLAMLPFTTGKPNMAAWKPVM